MIIHDLKIWPEYFEAIANGQKTFEIRINDRDYKIGDCIKLKEWDYTINGTPDKRYTGREIVGKITYLAPACWGQNYVVFSFKLLALSQFKYRAAYAEVIGARP